MHLHHENSSPTGRALKVTDNIDTETAYIDPDGAAGFATLNVGSTAQISGWLTGTAALDFASIAAGSEAELTLTVTGAANGDAVYLGAPSAIEAGVGWSGYVSAADTVTVRLRNDTAGAIDPASATWRAAVIQF